MTMSKQTVLERRILEHYTALDHNRQFVRPPSTDDELHEFILLGFGINVPRTRVVPHHRSPFEFIADLFFERVSNVLGFANRTGGKCLALDTPMLTARGWSTMGDLEVGDLVYSIDDKFTNVVSTSEVHLNHTCYRLTFDDGSQIVADSHHEWIVSFFAVECKMSTQEMYKLISDEKWLCLTSSIDPITKIVGSRIITDIRRTANVPVRCIGVDHPSHLYLAGTGLVPTHNTLSVSILNFLDMFFKPGCEIASAGATLAQTSRSYEYFGGFLEAEWFKRFCNRYYKNYGEQFVVQTIKAKTLFASGSKLEILTGTEKGFRSPHPHKARLDEIDEMEWSLLNTAFSMTKSSNGIQAQNVFTSTRQNERGTMQKLLDEAATKGIDIYEWNIWEAVQKCPRRCVGDPKHGDCPVKAFCEGRAHSSDGFYSITDFINKVKLLDRESWETEWLNLRPSRDKLVFAKFQNSKHVMTPEKLWKMTKLNAPSIHWPRVSGLDFGSSVGHPFAFIKCFQMPNGAWLAYWEYVAEADLLRNHASNIRKSPFFVNGETIYADWDAQDRLELAALGIRTQRAVKDVNTGIDYIKTLFAGQGPANGEQPMLYVWHECRNLIEELGLYQYNIINGKPSTRDAPKKDNDHLCFAAGTKIETIEGSKPIEKILVGDSVLTRKGFKKVVASALTDSAAEVVVATFLNGGELIGTPEHPIITANRGMVELQQLTHNDLLYTPLPKIQKGKQYEIGKVRPLGCRYNGISEVYNLTIEDNHEYFANGILVGNCDSLRYALFSHKSRNPVKYRSRRIEGI